MTQKGWTEWREAPGNGFVSSVDRISMRRTLLDRVLGRPGYEMLSCGARFREELPPGTAFRRLDGTMALA